MPFSPQKLASSETGICFYLLGPPDITWNDQPLAIQKRTARALLDLLACEGRPPSRGYLHLLFWPDQPESSARRSLSHYLTHLRRVLPVPQVLLTTHQCRLCCPRKSAEQAGGSHRSQIQPKGGRDNPGKSEGLYGSGKLNRCSIYP